MGYPLRDVTPSGLNAVCSASYKMSYSPTGAACFFYVSNTWITSEFFRNYTLSDRFCGSSLGIEISF